MEDRRKQRFISSPFSILDPPPSFPSLSVQSALATAEPVRAKAGHPRSLIPRTGRLTFCLENALDLNRPFMVKPGLSPDFAKAF